MSSDDDAALIARIAQSDERALRELFSRHSFEVYGFARSQVRRHEDAQDVVQQTFLSLWEGRRKLEMYTGSALPWLIVTARNHTRNLLRSRERREAKFAVDCNAEGLRQRDDPEEMILERESKAEVERAIAMLTPIERQIVTLCLEDDLLYKEAATKMGISHATVRNGLFRARRNLQIRLRGLRGEMDE